jgi:hypothetical protein
VRLRISYLSLVVACTLACRIGVSDPGPGPVHHDAGPHDAAACSCSIDGTGVLHMSWACFCTRFPCNEPLILCAETSYQSWTSACGLTTVGEVAQGGPYVLVYDQAGKLVGAHLSSDKADLVCPSDSTLTSTMIQAGDLPDAGCTTQACSCDAGPSCASMFDIRSRG